MSTPTSALILDDGHAPSYCPSDISPLSNNQISRILQCADTGFARGIIVFSEKNLVGKGNRNLFLLDETEICDENDNKSDTDSGTKRILIEYAGVRKAKFVTKDVDRYENMVAKAIEKLEIGENGKVIRVLLLGVEGMICRRNALKSLHRNGVVVMKCKGEGDSQGKE